MPDQHQDQANANRQQAIERVAVRIPPFWAADPETWFVQVENQFIISGIVSEDTRFSYVAANLDCKYAMEVRDVLSRPPETNKYTYLKNELIKRLSSSQEQKTKRLLEHEEIGDRKPSQFLRHLQNLAGSVVPDNIVRSLWVSRLPISMQAILATQANASLTSVADLADAVAETTARPQVHEAADGGLTTRALLEQLSAQIAALTTNHRPSRSNGYRQRSRSRSKSRQQGAGKDSNLCWYHSIFGAKARKCNQPCAFSSENDQGNR